MGSTFTGRLYLGQQATAQSVQAVSGNPNGVVSGNIGDIGLSDNGTLYVCQGGTVWLVIATTQSGLSAYGAFSSSITQTALAANTAYYMSFNTVETSNNVTIANNGVGNPTRITVSQAGSYEIGWSPQVHRSTGTQTTVAMWLTLNRESGGGNVLRSTSTTDVGGSVKTLLPYVSIILPLAAGDYIEIAWSADDANTDLLALPAQGSPSRPAAPSVIANVKRIG
jgi:hypothetical protein